MLKQLKIYSILFLFFFILILLFYAKVRDAKFVNDTFCYLYEIQNLGWKGIFQSYHMIFIWYVPSFFYWLIYSLFGLNWLGWHIVFSALHSINGVLLFVFLRKLFPNFSAGIALWAALLFVISPFQTEVIAWGATLHYLLIVFFFLCSTLFMIKYLEHPKLSYCIYFHIAFLCSLSCFEQAFLFPIFFMGIYFLFTDAKNKIVHFSKFFLNFIAGNLFSIALYFWATKIIYGTWIAHYGSKTHAQINITTLLECFTKYQMKFILLFRYLPVPFRIAFDHSWFFVIIHFVLALFVFYFTGKAWKQRESGNKFYRNLLFLMFAYVLMLVPVLNLDQSFHFEIQSDRYGYMASLFFYAAFVYSIAHFIHKRAYTLFFILYAFVLLYCLNDATLLWRKTGKMAMTLLKEYPLSAQQQAYILNLPDNYHGAYMFRNGFYEGLNLVKSQNYLQSIKIIATPNVFSQENETEVRKLTDSLFFVRCIPSGKWYYRLGHGATDYENEAFKVDFDEWNTAYTLQIKQLQTDTVFVMQCVGNKWLINDTLHQDTGNSSR